MSMMRGVGGVRAEVDDLELRVGTLTWDGSMQVWPPALVLLFESAPHFWPSLLGALAPAMAGMWGKCQAIQRCSSALINLQSATSLHLAFIS